MFSAATKSAAPVSSVKYIENYFQTWLRTGTGASATITTGLNASLNKALVWTKSRSAATDHKLTDTVRGATKALISDTTGAQTTDTNGLTAFSSTGYTIGSDTNYNNSGATYVDWEFVATPKFFDIVTYTGNGSNRTISHNLGSTPGCIIVKRTDTTGNWQVYHNGLTSAAYSIQLNLTNAQASATTVWNSTAPTSTVFSVGTSTDVNANTGTYVAYIFAHNAGGFGLTGTDNVISCGSYTGTGVAGNTVTLGYEPQFIMLKRADAIQDWFVADSMRGLFTGSTGDALLNPNLADAEATGTAAIAANATGFTLEGATTGFNASGGTYIYIAIRRGPMATPTTGTSVFSALTYAGNGSGTTGQSLTPGIVFDMAIDRYNRGGAGDWDAIDRLRGLSATSVSNSKYLNTYNTYPEATGGYLWNANSTTVLMYGFSSSFNQLNYFFKRAPNFFDEVCFQVAGPATVSHNLGVVPELIIRKKRSAGTGTWFVYSAALGATNYLELNTTSGTQTATSAWNDTAPTSSVFSVGSSVSSSETNVAYLFATCAGVSKVGTYSGTGSTQTISCGFTGGARLVLIKRTDSTGNWVIWDTARGMVSGTDPRLELNTTNAETNANWIYTTTGGFQIVTSDATVNASGGSYIYFSVA